MQLDEAVKRQIIRNALLSLFIYILPVLLMFISFYITGQRPWRQHVPASKPTALTGRNTGDFK